MFMEVCVPYEGASELLSNTIMDRFLPAAQVATCNWNGQDSTIDQATAEAARMLPLGKCEDVDISSSLRGLFCIDLKSAIFGREARNHSSAGSIDSASSPLGESCLTLSQDETSSSDVAVSKSSQGSPFGDVASKIGSLSSGALAERAVYEETGIKADHEDGENRLDHKPANDGECLNRFNWDLEGYSSARAGTDGISNVSVEWDINVSKFADAGSQFETPRSSFSTDKSSTSASVSAATFKPSSNLSLRIGKPLKIDTVRKNVICSGAGHLWSGFTSQRPKEQGSTALPRMMKLEHQASTVNGERLGLVSSIFPPKCQKNPPLKGLGWPFGTASCHYQLHRNMNNSQTDRSATAAVLSSPRPRPPPPLPSPSSPWLGKAIAVLQCSPSTLAILQTHKITSAVDAELGSTATATTWEDDMKGSHVQPAHLRFAKELRYHHPLNLGELRPLRL